MCLSESVCGICVYARMHTHPRVYLCDYLFPCLPFCLFACSSLSLRVSVCVSMHATVAQRGTLAVNQIRQACAPSHGKSTEYEPASEPLTNLPAENAPQLDMNNYGHYLITHAQSVKTRLAAQELSISVVSAARWPRGDCGDGHDWPWKRSARSCRDVYQYCYRIKWAEKSLTTTLSTLSTAGWSWPCQL